MGLRPNSNGFAVSPQLAAQSLCLRSSAAHEGQTNNLLEEAILRKNLSLEEAVHLRGAWLEPYTGGEYVRSERGACGVSEADEAASCQPPVTRLVAGVGADSELAAGNGAHTDLTEDS